MYEHRDFYACIAFDKRASYRHQDAVEILNMAAAQSAKAQSSLLLPFVKVTCYICLCAVFNDACYVVLRAFYLLFFPVTSERLDNGRGAKSKDSVSAAAFGGLRQGYLLPETLSRASYTFLTTRRERFKARQIAKSNSRTIFSRSTMGFAATVLMSITLRAIILRNSMRTVCGGRKLRLPAQLLPRLRVVSVRVCAKRLRPLPRRFAMRGWSPKPLRRQLLRLLRRSRSWLGRLLLPLVPQGRQQRTRLCSRSVAFARMREESPLPF
jgi:hypothetical protein